VVGAPELSRRLGINPKRLRAWLRELAAAGNPLVAGHEHNATWEFAETTARALEAEYRSIHRPAGPARTSVAVRGPARASVAPTVDHARSASPAPALDGPGHRVVEEWMGEQVQTLADLLRLGLRAVIVGINPAPDSVAVGYYYQGALGRQLWSRLRGVGMVRSHESGFEDDAAFASGVGFTDIVKRPTPGEKDVAAAEFQHGRDALVAKLEHYRPPLVIFTFKRTAVKLFGPFPGNGFVDGLRLASSDVFVMPGPYEAGDTANATLDTLRAYLG
jgi:TDG/mug DNA glycosylase family protein